MQQHRGDARATTQTSRSSRETDQNRDAMGVSRHSSTPQQEEAATIHTDTTGRHQRSSSHQTQLRPLTDRQLKKARSSGGGAGETAISRRVEMSAQWRFAGSVGGFWLCSARLNNKNPRKKKSGVSKLVRVWGIKKKVAQKMNHADHQKGGQPPVRLAPSVHFFSSKNPPIRQPEVEVALAGGLSFGAGWSTFTPGAARACLCRSHRSPSGR